MRGLRVFRSKLLYKAVQGNLWDYTYGVPQGTDRKGPEGAPEPVKAGTRPGAEPEMPELQDRFDGMPAEQGTVSWKTGGKLFVGSDPC